MLSMKPEQYSKLRAVLLRCREFESYRTLRAIFVTTELSPFRFGLREADNSATLVDLFLEYIFPQKLHDGQPVLPIFLAILRDRYPQENALFIELDQIYKEVQATVRATSTIHLRTPKEKHLLFDQLLRLDFRSQIQLVRRVIDEQRIGAFIIHGPPDYGQRVLAYRLSHLLPKWETGHFIVIDAGSNGTGKSSRSLWREVAKRLDLPTDTDKSLLAEKVCQWWQTQDVIFVFHTVDYIPAPILSTWLSEFWKAIVDMACQCDYMPIATTHLLLFLVDYSGCVCDYDLPLAHLPEQARDLHLALLLPTASRFPENELDIWLDTASEVLPTRIPVQLLLQNSENGIPDLVYEKICIHCGYSWEGEIAP